MMEEFRPFFADRLALSLMNLGRVRGKGFTQAETGAVSMDRARWSAVFSRPPHGGVD